MNCVRSVTPDHPDRGTARSTLTPTATSRNGPLVVVPRGHRTPRTRPSPPRAGKASGTGSPCREESGRTRSGRSRRSPRRCVRGAGRSSTRSRPGAAKPSSPRSSSGARTPRSRRQLFLVHRRELVRQAFDTLSEILGAGEVGVIAAGWPPSPLGHDTGRVHPDVHPPAAPDAGLRRHLLRRGPPRKGRDLAEA